MTKVKKNCSKVKKEKIMTSMVRASHILVKTEEEATALREKIVNGETAFEDAAAMVSLCPSGANGGDLGFFGKGQMVKPFEDACFSMEVNEVSNPIQTQFGWHLIQLTGKED